MTYLVDQKDVEFNLYEYLDLNELTQMENFKEQSSDMYKMILNECLKLAQSEMDPLFVSGDREGCHIEDGQVKTPKGFDKAYQALAQNGMIGMDVSPEYGGQGLPITLGVVASEFFNGSNVPLTMYIGLTRGAAHLIESFGEKKYAELFCPKMYGGQWGGTMCLTEPGAGSAVGDLKSVAKPNGDGTYNITGSKIFISSGDHDLTENIIHLFLARVEGDQPGTKGISLFVVPKIWVNEDGSLGEANDVNCVNVEHKMGIKASATCSLNFGENGKCRGFLVGEQGKGMSYMFQMMNEARLMCGMQGAAVAAASYMQALNYAKDRVQGGDNTLVKYPDVRRNLALMKAWTEGMRAMLYKTAVAADVANHSTDEAKKEKAQNRLDLMTPICKAYCSDFGFKVTEIAMQVYGGYGYISEYPVEQYMRDVKISSIYEGTNGIQALDLLGRKLAQKNGQLFRDFYEELTQFSASLESVESLKEAGGDLKKAADTIGQVAMKFAEWGMGGDRITPQLGATAFLEMCGHVCIAQHLLEQAKLAQEKIDGGSSDSFYSNKIKTAQFFVNEVLPNVRARAKSILSGSKAAMEIDF